MHTKILLTIATLCLGNAFCLMSQNESSETVDFEGQLNFELNVGGRTWTLVHLIKGNDFRTDVYLGDLKFQSLLNHKGKQYLIDTLSKRITPMGQGSMGFPPQRKKGDEKTLPPEPSAKSDDHNQSRPSRHRGMMGFGSMNWVDPELPTGKGIAFSTASLKFEFKLVKRMVRMEGIPGYGTFPIQILDQYEGLRELAPTIISTLKEYQLMPVELHVEKRKKNKAISLKLKSIDEIEISDEAFELPSGYSMRMGRSGRAGMPGSGRPPPQSGGRTGPPPGRM